jgi:hypothetical protein
MGDAWEEEAEVQVGGWHVVGYPAASHKPIHFAALPPNRAGPSRPCPQFSQFSQSCARSHGMYVPCLNAPLSLQALSAPGSLLPQVLIWMVAEQAARAFWKATKMTQHTLRSLKTRDRVRRGGREEELQAAWALD